MLLYLYKLILFLFKTTNINSGDGRAIIGIRKTTGDINQEEYFPT